MFDSIENRQNATSLSNAAWTCVCLENLDIKTQKIRNSRVIFTWISYFTCEFLIFWVSITFLHMAKNVWLKMCRHVISLVVLGPQIYLNINFCFLKKLFRPKNYYKVSAIVQILTYSAIIFVCLEIYWVCSLKFFCESASH